MEDYSPKEITVTKTFNQDENSHFCTIVYVVNTNMYVSLSLTNDTIDSWASIKLFQKAENTVRLATSEQYFKVH